MSEQSPVDKLSGLEQEYIKAELLKAFQGKQIITEVYIDWNGRLEIHSTSWNEYWNDSHLLPSDLQNILDDLRIARNRYYNEFNLSHADDYCYCYFRLLSKILREIEKNKSENVNIVLSKVLAFENFKISWYGGNPGLAAGTTSHRNPAYLLCKIKGKTVADDPKYMPLIALANRGTIDLFYHYRQYRVCREPNISIFVYPAVELKERGGSFTIIESFLNGISRKSDPRSKQRAQLIANGAILPFLKATYENKERKREIDFVDLGGGDGLLVRHIWETILKDKTTRKDWRLNCSFVGLRVHHPARHFARGNIKNNLSYLDYLQRDYLEWIENSQEENNGQRRCDIILMCRLLNNISIFDIEHTNDEGDLWDLMGKQTLPRVLRDRKFKPEICLDPQDRHSEILSLSNGQTQMSAGHSAYRVISLTDYYKGIQLFRRKQTLFDPVYFPVRRTNEQSLMMRCGKSILAKLIRLAKMIVIEDVDLTYPYLRKHIEKFEVTCCASAINICPRYSSQILVIADKQFEKYLPGTRIC